MSDWLTAFESLSDESKANVQQWIHLNRFIAATLNIPADQWFDEYIGDAMRYPFDYSFLLVAFPGFLPPVTESAIGRAIATGSFAGTEVPLRASNNMGRFSPELQDALAKLIKEGGSVKMTPADVAQAQKIFRDVKPVATLKRPNFRKVILAHDPDSSEFTMTVEGGEELLRMNVMEFTAILSRKLH